MVDIAAARAAVTVRSHRHTAMKNTTRSDATALKLRIRVVKPVVGCVYAVQRGKADVEQAVAAGDADIEFVLDVVIHTVDDRSDVRGANVQGPRGARFVYINSGTLAGQTGTCWTRRAKVPLQGAIDLLVQPLSERIVALEARIDGRARDGGPACASVPLLGEGWSWQR
jgi:hypothetical protein